MRITVKTVPAGAKFLSRFAQFTGSIEDLSTDGHFDEMKFRAMLKDWQDAGYVLWGSDDRGAVCAFAAEFLRQLTLVTEAVEADDTTDAHTAANSAADRRLVARADRGRCAFTRFDITSRRDDLLVRVSCGNPLDIPGSALESARRFAGYACRTIRHIQREVHAAKSCKITLQGVGDLADIFDEADWADRRMAERDAVDAANAKRMMCACRLGEYCSPSDPRCRCYRDGRCVEAVLPKEFERWEGSHIGASRYLGGFDTGGANLAEI
jgi:hypothetical protein